VHDVQIGCGRHVGFEADVAELRLRGDVDRHVLAQPGIHRILPRKFAVLIAGSRIRIRINLVCWIGYGSGSRRAKMTHKNKNNKEISCVEVLDVLF
jgi:hypothetical protein